MKRNSQSFVLNVLNSGVLLFRFATSCAVTTRKDSLPLSYTLGYLIDKSMDWQCLVICYEKWEQHSKSMDME